MRLNLATAPATDFLEDEKVYDHLRVETTGSPPAPVDASYILLLRDDAQSMLDGYSGILGRALITQTWELYLDQFPRVDRLNDDARITLPLPPLQSVDEITYTDGDGATQTLASSKYTVGENGDGDAFIVPAYDESWPSTRAVPNAVKVTFSAGFGDAATDVPAAIRIAGLEAIRARYDALVDKDMKAVQAVIDQAVAAYGVVHVR